MKETDKEYYTRRGSEERKRARGAGSLESRLIHGDLADLCNEKAGGSANFNSRQGIRAAPTRRPPGPDTIDL